MNIYLFFFFFIIFYSFIGYNPTKPINKNVYWFIAIMLYGEMDMTGTVIMKFTEAFIQATNEKEQNSLNMGFNYYVMFARIIES